MGNVRYKKPTEGFERFTSSADQSNLRVSIGRDQSVGEFYFLSVKNLMPYEKQARKFFSEEEIDELASTISEHGIKSPLLVAASQKETGKFEVISGERRLRAALKIGLEKVPCIIIENDRAEEVALIENIQRANLHPIELGESLASLLSQPNSRFGDATKLSKELGKSSALISQHLSYAKLPDPIKKHLIENNIRSTPILRKLVQIESVEDMELFLGMRNKEKKVPMKSVLRINMDSDKILVQDKKLYQIGHENLRNVKERLLEILKKIEETI